MLIWLVGITMMAVTMALHAMGSARWLYFIGGWMRHRRETRTGASEHLFTAVLATSVALLLLHALEALLWALVYLALPESGGLDGLDQAMYFSIATLTTLGYGDVVLDEPWQLLAGMEAMVGICVFGLTTALQFAVIQQSWKRSHSSSGGV